MKVLIASKLLEHSLKPMFLSLSILIRFRYNIKWYFHWCLKYFRENGSIETDLQFNTTVLQPVLWIRITSTLLRLSLPGNVSTHWLRRIVRGLANMSLFSFMMLAGISSMYHFLVLKADIKCAVSESVVMGTDMKRGLSLRSYDRTFV